MELQEIYDIWPTIWYQTLWGKGLIVLSILFILAIFTILFRLIKRTPKITFAEKAKRDLKKLLAQAEIGENVKKIYLDLTMILKEYIEKKFNLECGLTDIEIIDFLSDKEKSYKDIIDKIITIFKKSQLIKFAQQNEDLQIIKSDIHASLQFIDQSFDRK